MTTRSIVLAQGQLLGRVSGTIYTCPAASHVILKSYALQTDVSPQPQIVMSLTRPGKGNGCWIVNATAFSGMVLQAQTWHVLEPGDFVTLYAQTGNISYWLSGAQLPV